MKSKPGTRCGWLVMMTVVALCGVAEVECGVGRTGNARAAEVADAEDAEWGPLAILGHSVAPGSSARISLSDQPSFTAHLVDVRVLVSRGAEPGPTLCLVGAIHGDELNGVEIARRSYQQIDPANLGGTLVAVPIVNGWGFRSGNRYLADRRDLNRAFPGNRDGSLASRIAHHLFDRIIRHCDFVLDLHTGSGDRANMPQTRVDPTVTRAVDLALRFDVGIVLFGAGPKGSLRQAADAAGIATVLYEAGGPHRFEHDEIERGIEGVTNVMEALGMVSGKPPKANPQRLFESSSWVRAPLGGIFISNANLGDEIEQGRLLGHVSDPVTGERLDVAAPFAGTLIGMAHSQVVLPGFGLFHIARHEGEASDFSETE